MTAHAGGMGVKVSVIVNVHNPGDRADACIRSTLEQTLPADDYEVIFVDDGSTDGVAERLDTVAAVRRNVRVLHLPHTGSPMRGRNVGLASARGDYVYLLDQYDRLERDALERMHERAAETDADVLVGRLARDGGAPMTAFDRSKARADILRDRLLSLLTPHKLYRRAFLEEHELGFAVPGGPIAEQDFVMRAYLQAKVIAVLAEHVCCHLGERTVMEENPRTTVRELRALLGHIDAYVGEGRQRDRMYAHWLRTAVLRPFLTTAFASSSIDRGAYFRMIQDLVGERFPDRLDRYLPVQLRAIATLIRAGRLDQLVMLANSSRRAGLRADLTEVRWDAHVLVLGLAVEVLGGDGRPDRFRTDGERLYWKPPRAIDAKLLPDHVTDVTDSVERARIEVYVRHAETGDVHFLPVAYQVERVPEERRHARVRITGEARMDVIAAAQGEPLRPGQWEVHVRMFGGAYQARSRVRRTDGPLNCLGVLAQRPRMRLVVPCWTDDGQLGLAVEPRSFTESIALVSPGSAGQAGGGAPVRGAARAVRAAERRAAAGAGAARRRAAAPRGVGARAGRGRGAGRDGRPARGQGAGQAPDGGPRHPRPRRLAAVAAQHGGGDRAALRAGDAPGAGRGVPEQRGHPAAALAHGPRHRPAPPGPPPARRAAPGAAGPRGQASLPQGLTHPGLPLWGRNPTRYGEAVWPSRCRRSASWISSARSGSCQPSPSSLPILSRRCVTVLTWMCMASAVRDGEPPQPK